MPSESSAAWLNTSTADGSSAIVGKTLSVPHVILYIAIVLVPGVLFKIFKTRKVPKTIDQDVTSTPAQTKKKVPIKDFYPGAFPGPRLFPIIGRVHDLPRFSMWLKLKEWADEYGPIFQTRMLNQKFIIISNEELGRDLLTKNGNSYAGRPQIQALINHKVGPVYSALMDRHDTWKYQRRWVHSAMALAHQQHFFGHVERETKRYLATLLMDPEKFHAYTREMTGRVTCRLAWDDAAQGKLNGDTAIETLTQMSVSGPIINTASPLWNLADLIRYNPWRDFEVAREGRLKAWWRQMLLVTRKRFLEGNLPDDTWAYRYFEQLENNGNPTLEMSEEDILMASCMLGFQALVGAVTISGPMQFFIMAMGLHPEWLQKCQDEIDRVCGDRMPTTSDSPNLPTVRACLKEVVRWRSGVPLGVPHQCEKDHEFRGVLISKGTIILACEWNINRDEEVYPDHEHYRPDRWLDPSFPTYQEPLSRYPNFREGKGMHSFGWGRRTCLGQTIVDDEMFVAGASLCWAFNIKQKVCPLTGKVVEFDNQATNSNVILEPVPFPMDIKPRSDERAKLILEQYNEIRSEIRV
ncbi:hypothetical protein Cpir12675_004089 [Ceratocystis pirilliformis]|uniref:Cytochrome P450 n=1 Tax=Ceratocystis pirilliformis TaxID=259994 RepID=A0ABR3YYH4_9PEZI